MNDFVLYIGKGNGRLIVGGGRISTVGGLRDSVSFVVDEAGDNVME